AMQALAAGIAKAGEDDPAAVAAAMKAAPIDTVMGPLTWAPNGDLKGFEFGVFQWHADGTSTQLK
ncbi:MAG: leucine ABC transporter subunit substrate-binding protein LivK, partial [Aeromonas sobria]